MTSKRRIIIDTDPGIDDAAALAIAMHASELDVRLITTVCGNVGVDKVTLNALKLLTFFKQKTPVAMGASEPLLEDLVDASNVHGLTGMEGYEFPQADKSLLLECHAVEAMRQEIESTSALTTIVAIGPMTNIALLIKMYPHLKEKIEEVVFMGGSMNRGNRTVMAEFNAATDPEALKIVIDSGLKIVMLPLDIGLKALIYPEDSIKIKTMNSCGDMLYQLFQKYRGGSLKTGLKMYDSTAIAYLLKPSLYDLQKVYVDVEVKSSHCNGLTLVDVKNYLQKEANCTVAVDVDASEFSKWFLKCIDQCKF